MASLLDVLNKVASRKTVSRKEFGKIMHDENITDEKKFEILKEVEDFGGYENLPID